MRAIATTDGRIGHDGAQHLLIDLHSKRSRAYIRYMADSRVGILLLKVTKRNAELTRYLVIPDAFWA